MEIPADRWQRQVFIGWVGGRVQFPLTEFWLQAYKWVMGLIIKPNCFARWLWYLNPPEAITCLWGPFLWNNLHADMRQSDRTGALNLNFKPISFSTCSVNNTFHNADSHMFHNQHPFTGSNRLTYLSLDSLKAVHYLSQFLCFYLSMKLRIGHFVSGMISDHSS